MSEETPKTVKPRFTFDEVYTKLKEPFAKEALSVDSSRGFNLTSLKAQYIVERLNEVCGIDGWVHRCTYSEVPGGILCQGTLIIDNGVRGIAREASGFSAIKKNVGDAYKGAQTDSLSKCASKFGLGNEIFKGNVAPPTKGSTTKPKLKRVSNSDF